MMKEKVFCMNVKNDDGTIILSSSSLVIKQRFYSVLQTALFDE